jgi:hypothetical protein
MARLPTSVAGFERINEIPITFESHIAVDKDNFHISSAVVADVNNSLEPGSNFVIGSDAIIFDSMPGPVPSMQPIKYTPGTVIKRKNNEAIIDMNQADAQTEVSERGIVFIYVNRFYTTSVGTLSF